MTHSTPGPGYRGGVRRITAPAEKLLQEKHKLTTATLTLNLTLAVGAVFRHTVLGSARWSKMSDRKQGIYGNVISVRGSSVRCKSECNLDSDSSPK